jgi:hypothetical protein
MLNACFQQAPNVRRRQPRATQVVAPVVGSLFEARAFNTLLNQAGQLGIQSLWRCHAARVDGYLVTDDGEHILVEMKECLGWSAFQAASAEFVMGRGLLGIPAQRGIIVFERTSHEWDSITPHGAWGQLALHSSELSPHLEVGGLQITAAGNIHFSPLTVGTI